MQGGRKVCRGAAFEAQLLQAPHKRRGGGVRCPRVGCPRWGAALFGGGGALLRVVSFESAETFLEPVSRKKNIYIIKNHQEKKKSSDMIRKRNNKPVLDIRKTNNKPVLDKLAVFGGVGIVLLSPVGRTVLDGVGEGLSGPGHTKIITIVINNINSSA